MSKIITQHINNGFVEPKLTPEDYIAGAERSIANKAIELGFAEEVVMPDGDWSKAAVADERQSVGFDTFGCTVFNSLTQLETYFKGKFGVDANFSDRFTYNDTGISPPGADPNRAYESERNTGVIPEGDFPWNVSTLVEYSQPRPPSSEHLTKAKEWRDRYVLKHEYLPKGLNGKVEIEQIYEQLKYSPVAIAVQAWSFDAEKQKYVRTGADTHWTLCIGRYPDGDLMLRDSYEPFIKRLDKNFGIFWAKKIWISKRISNEEAIGILERIKQALLNILALLSRMGRTLGSVSYDTLNGLLERLKKLLNELLKKELPKPIDSVPIEVKPEKIDWRKWYVGRGWKEYAEEGKKEAFRMAKRKCEEAGFDEKRTTEFLATIMAESGWNVFCINENKINGKVVSTDFSLTQLNDYWYLRPRNLTGEQVMNNPELAVDIMIDGWKRGREDDWIAHRNGGYRNFLKNVLG